MRKAPDTILALDPGLRDLGYAVLSGRRLVTCGVLGLRRVGKKHRLATARKHVIAWIRTHRPSVVVVEKTYRHPVPWLNQLHQISRSAQNLATRQSADFAMYSPQSVRATIAGNGKAKKPEVAVAVAHRFPSLRVYLTQDRRWKERYWQNMFDAIALALHHQATHPPSRSRSSD
ncbi:MAG TPA: crossover junction endodeoxyribonuclease RuvC [Candidatus Eisenbacteria bacterium]|jgi:Holliday junction resolvasome RuvABC endonuclease subunit